MQQALYAVPIVGRESELNQTRKGRTSASSMQGRGEAKERGENE